MAPTRLPRAASSVPLPTKDEEPCSGGTSPDCPYCWGPETD
jgi:hypothetical protein